MRQMSKFTQMLKQQAVPWWVILLEGLGAIIIGVMIFMNPANTLDLFIKLMGVFLIVKGILALLSIFTDKSNWGYKILVGLIAIGLGALVFLLPEGIGGVLRVTLLLMIGFGALLIAAIDIIKSLTGGGCGVGVLGLLIGLLGLVVLGNSAVASEYIPYIIGALSVVGGLVAVFVAFRSRS
jgi:uncharacterized membrane protein HdeD (DUF308 family)